MEKLTEKKRQNPFKELIALIAQLRGEKGCPWDKKQTPKSIAVYLIEEVYELVDAIQSEDLNLVMEELGDVLFQIFFLLELFEKAGNFTILDVVEANITKMKRRHPHVFGNETINEIDQIKSRWRQIKEQEKGDSEINSVLNSIPKGLPALLRAYRISERAAGIGFDWDSIDEVMAQTREEWIEFIREVIKEEKGIEKQGGEVAMEFGDILFSLVNVARFAKIHPETALLDSIQKFERRFEFMEKSALESGKELVSLSRNEWDMLWHKAKKFS